MKIAVVDPNTEDRAALIRVFSSVSSSVPETAEFNSGSELLAHMVKGGFNAIFTEIDIGTPNGIETARAVREKDPDVYLVFVTERNDYAAESYELKANNYLQKPVSEVSLKKILKDVGVVQDKIYLPNDISIPINEIVYTEYFNHRIYIHRTNRENTVVWMAHKDMESLLKPFPMFIAASRGVILNVCEIRSLDDNLAIMKTGSMVPVSRRLYPALKKAFTDYRASI
ncbi:MAG: response regulator transcription factor [Solobacterium sp.]|nr:response regulator transcription factor [Solobacterium sp.]